MSITERKDVKPQDCWDLTVLFPTDQNWEDEFIRIQKEAPQLLSFAGRLGEGIKTYREANLLSDNIGQILEKLGHYAQLKVSENVADPLANQRLGRFQSYVTQFYSQLSFWDVELMTLPKETHDNYLESPDLEPWKISLEKILHHKPHILTEAEEKILALGSESRSAISKTFSSLTNADLDFGTLEVQGEQKPLTQSTYSLFLQNPLPEVRRRAYLQFYSQFEKHANTLSSLYTGSIQQDVYKSRVRKFTSSRSMALFPDKVPEEVYDNLVQVVTEHLPLLHRYYRIRKTFLGLEKLHHSDLYAPMLKGIDMVTPFDKAVELVSEAVTPLGREYQEVLTKGLTGGWVDKYENKGKRSGAFSSGAWEGHPYILMNYKETDLRDVFTLAHEAGHSMHSWYSVKNNSYSSYNYTIFEAEVASTVNEQLLAKYLLEKTTDANIKKFLVSKQVEDTVATLFRQTMFAEFEHLVHVKAETEGGVTLEWLRQTYRNLLTKYLGSDVELEDCSDLEGLRIPHFYNAFYVYKYATGLSAAMALAKGLLTGDEKKQKDYLAFLSSGGSRYPLESLKVAGVDMSSPQPIKDAMEVFKNLLDQLEQT